MLNTNPAPSDDPDATAATTRARTREGLEDRRLRLAGDLLSDAERLRTQLWSPALSHHWGREVKFDERGKPTSELPVMASETIAQPVFSDQKQIMLSVAIAIDKSQLLAGEATSRTETIEPEQAATQIAELQEKWRQRMERHSKAK